MACLRGISKRVNLLPRRVYPLCGHRFGDDKHDNKPVSSPNPMINKFFPHIGTESLDSVFLERQYKSFVRPVGFGLSSCRYMSSTPAEWSHKVDGSDFVATEVARDEILESVTSQVVPAINEVAFTVPVDVVQHLINGVHSVTGLNWWADIALTTLIINGLTLPLLLYQTKTFHKIDASDPETILKEIRKEEKTLYKKYGVNKSTLLATFFFARLLFPFLYILDMAHKIPSFKTGGTLWFTDLAIADSTFSLPVLTTVTIAILGAKLLFKDVHEFMYRYKADVYVPVPTLLTLYLGHLESAVLCYWLTSALFFIGYGVVIRRPAIWKLLNLSNVTVSLTPSSSSSLMPSSSSNKKNKK